VIWQSHMHQRFDTVTLKNRIDVVVTMMTL